MIWALLVMVFGPLSVAMYLWHCLTVPDPHDAYSIKTFWSCVFAAIAFTGFFCLMGAYTI